MGLPTLKELDAMQESAKYKELYEILTEECGEDGSRCKDVDLLWRLARAKFDMGDESADQPKRREALMRETLLIAERLKTEFPASACGYKWWALTQSQIGEYIGVKENIKNSFEIRDCALKALKIDGNDSTTTHMLGRWCYAVSNLGWLQKKAAAVFFATPPESTFEEALEWFLKAEKLEPGFKANLQYVGLTYEALKRKDDAKEVYARCLEISDGSMAHKKIDEDVKKALKKL